MYAITRNLENIYLRALKIAGVDISNHAQWKCSNQRTYDAYIEDTHRSPFKALKLAVIEHLNIPAEAQSGFDIIGRSESIIVIGSLYEVGVIDKDTASKEAMAYQTWESVQSRDQ